MLLLITLPVGPQHYLTHPHFLFCNLCKTGLKNNTTTIFPVPIDILDAFKSMAQKK